MKLTPLPASLAGASAMFTPKPIVPFVRLHVDTTARVISPRFSRSLSPPPPPPPSFTSSTPPRSIFSSGGAPASLPLSPSSLAILLIWLTRASKLSTL
eukprot:CAMPEP_0182462572 /NCGR_PEP_ID=MMETSP1319-20130603/6781_1 /TAXON_ID=172717 /ORGANISM="Bolidomonas pacifica, Strain RCC208" /LENGTH=97 /DNA_ID=CAMNT_0024662009 /DNA_START=155 /DNA_END=448 /DNA_ORIENTATION=+